MNRAIKDAPAFRNGCGSHDQPRDHLVAFVATYKSLRRQKTPGGLTHSWTISYAWKNKPGY